jgi:hypothetical protein
MWKKTLHAMGEIMLLYFEIRKTVISLWHRKESATNEYDRMHIKA